MLGILDAKKKNGSIYVLQMWKIMYFYHKINIIVFKCNKYKKLNILITKIFKYYKYKNLNIFTLKYLK